MACESAAVRRVARQFGLAESTVRAIDLRYLERWAPGRKKRALRQMGVDEIDLGRSQKFLTVVSNLETGEPLWFGRERKKETLDELFTGQLSRFQRGAIRAACVDMWEPFRQSNQAAKILELARSLRFPSKRSRPSWKACLRASTKLPRKTLRKLSWGRKYLFRERTERV